MTSVRTFSTLIVWKDEKYIALVAKQTRVPFPCAEEEIVGGSKSLLKCELLGGGGHAQRAPHIVKQG